MFSKLKLPKRLSIVTHFHFSPVASTIFLIKLIALASLFILLPEQLCFLISLIILLSHRTPIDFFVNEIVNLANPLNGVPNNICS